MKSAMSVLFDMDGTLIDSEPTHYQAMVYAITHLGGLIPENFMEQATGMSIEDCYKVLNTHAAVDFSLAQLEQVKSVSYLKLVSTLTTRAGANSALDLLSNRCVKMAIVSNSDRVIVDANLRAVGLNSPGLISVSRNDVVMGKPDPEPYLRAAYLLGAEPKNCIVVEDSIVGAMSGLTAGMTVIGWPDPQRTHIGFPDGTHTANPHDLASTLRSLLSI
jgi:beta-phosphoglucomutase-like phosphatase (HAD superfamily)